MACGKGKGQPLANSGRILYDSNMKLSRAGVLTAAVLAVTLIGCGWGAPDVSQTNPDDAGDSKGADAKAEVTKPVIDLKRQEVRVKVRVCLARGILEFITVMRGGRDHEAVFSTTCLSSNLHTALLMIGMEPYSFIPDNPGWYEKARKSKSRIRIEVEFDDQGQKRRVPIGELLKNREVKGGDTEDTWVFTGSFFRKHEDKSVYAADYSDVVISIIPAPEAVIQYAAETGTPYSSDNLGIEVAGAIVEVGTEVMLVLSPWHRSSQTSEGNP